MHGALIFIAMIAAGGVMTAVLLGLANAHDHIRLRDRLRHQRALGELEAHGDVPLLPQGLRGATETSPGEGAVKAAPAQVRTQEAIARSHRKAV